MCGIAASGRSKSWRTAPKASSCSSSEPRARGVASPRSSAHSTAAATSELLPVPAAPSTTTSRPSPRHAPARAVASSESSCSRSSSRTRGILNVSPNGGSGGARLLNEFRRTFVELLHQ